MATSYPTSADAFTNPTSTDDLSASVGGRTHAAFHADMNDAMEAVQAKVGPTGAAAAAAQVMQYGYALDSGCGTTHNRLAFATSATLSSGVLYLSYFRAPTSFTAGTVRWGQATNAGATPTISRWGIYAVDASTGALTSLLGSTTNDTALFTSGASSTVPKTKALAAGTALTQHTWYALGVLVVTGASNPTIHCENTGTIQGMWWSALPRITAQIGGQTDLPASVAAGSLAASNQRILAELIP